LIRVSDLAFAYGGGPRAVVGLSFEIGEGEIFGFLGPSGAGKTTTQNILIRLIRGWSGEVEALGRRLQDWGPDYFEQVGVSFEFPSHYRKLTARENLSLFAAFHAAPTRRPEELLEMVGLSDAADKRVEAFSKGMKARLNLARALTHRPKLLFLDEPTAGLDPVNARRVRELIKAHRAEGGSAFLTTHDMHVADELCDRVGFLVEGRLREVGAPERLKLDHGRRAVKVGHDGGEAEFPLDGLGENSDFLELIRTRRIDTIHSQEPTLEDVFIAVTGRELA